MINCPVCGGALSRLTPLRRNRTCVYCGHLVHYHDATKTHESSNDISLLSTPSFLDIGNRLLLDGVLYEVSGLIRFLATGHNRIIERWWITIDSDNSADVSNGHWISFNGESYRLLSTLPLQWSRQTIQGMCVGNSLMDDRNKTLLVVERQTLSIQASFGVLPSPVSTGAEVLRIEAVGARRQVIVDLYDQDQHIFRSEPLADSRLKKPTEQVSTAPQPDKIASNNRLSRLSLSMQPASPVEQTLDQSAVVFTCGKCGGTLRSRYRASLRIVCGDCGECTDLIGKRNDPMLRAAGRAFDHLLSTQRSEFGLGSRLIKNAVHWRVIAVQVFEGKENYWKVGSRVVTNYGYSLWWLLNERQEIAWIGEHAGQRFWSEPTLPDDAELPDFESKLHIFGEWTLTDAVGEFPYRIEPGERHRTIESHCLPSRLSIELFLDVNNEPWRIQHSLTTALEDSDVMTAMSDPEGAKKVIRLRYVKHCAIVLAILLLLMIPVVWSVAPDVFQHHKMLLVTGPLLSVFTAMACEMVASHIGHQRAFLTFGNRTES